MQQDMYTCNAYFMQYQHVQHFLKFNTQVSSITVPFYIQYLSTFVNSILHVIACDLNNLNGYPAKVLTLPLPQAEVMS